LIAVGRSFFETKRALGFADLKVSDGKVVIRSSRLPAARMELVTSTLRGTRAAARNGVQIVLSRAVNRVHDSRLRILAKSHAWPEGKMNIEEAFRHALDGDAILFLGAGFSLGAYNNRGDEFPLPNDLACHLIDALGETEVVKLQTASELFAKRGDVAGGPGFEPRLMESESLSRAHCER
jgi:hypothetical protein